MLAYIREGDIVLVTELDRLGRNNQDLTKIMNTIQNKGATLDVLNLPSMTGIADPNLRQLMTNLIIELYKYQAESERKRIIERQQQGIALAQNSKVNITDVNPNTPKTIPACNMLLNFIRQA